MFLKSILYSPMCLSVSGFEISLDISLEVSWYFYFLRSDAEGGFFLEKNAALLSLFIILLIVSMTQYIFTYFNDFYTSNYFTDTEFMSFSSFFSPAQMRRHTLGVGPQLGFGVYVDSCSPKG